MEKIHVILLINSRTGQRGYLIDGAKGILIAIGGMHTDVKQFFSIQKAEKFIRDRKLERKGIKAYVRDIDDLVRDESGKGISQMNDRDLFYLENIKGEKLFFDVKKESYYFDGVSVGFCCWETWEQLADFVKQMDFKEQTIIKNFKRK